MIILDLIWWLRPSVDGTTIAIDHIRLIVLVLCLILHLHLKFAIICPLLFESSGRRYEGVYGSPNSIKITFLSYWKVIQYIEENIIHYKKSIYFKYVIYWIKSNIMKNVQYIAFLSTGLLLIFNNTITSYMCWIQGCGDLAIPFICFPSQELSFFDCWK